MSPRIVHLDRLTDDVADRITHDLCVRFGAVVRAKASSVLMGDVTTLLEYADQIRAAAHTLGLPIGALDTLLDRLPSAREWPTYGTTVGPLVFMPEEPVPKRRLRMVVHEITHVTEGKRDGWLAMAERYIRFERWRVAYEGAGYTAEWEFWQGLHPDEALPPLNEVVRIDHGYALTDEGVKFGGLLTEQALTSMASGLRVQPVAAEALALCGTYGVIE